MFMDLPTTHQLITVILQPTRSSVSRCIVGHICVLAGGGEDGVTSTEGDGGAWLSQKEAKRLLAKFDRREGKLNDWVSVLIVGLFVVCVTVFLLLDPKSRTPRKDR